MAKNSYVVATGKGWIGHGIRSFADEIHDLLTGATEQIVMTAYLIRDDSIIRDIDRASKRGVSIEIFYWDSDDMLVNRITVDRLSLMPKSDNIRIHPVREGRLHAKVIVVDREIVLLGSANLTYSAMTDNYELGLIIKDGKIASDVIGLLLGLDS